MTRSITERSEEVRKMLVKISDPANAHIVSTEVVSEAFAQIEYPEWSEEDVARLDKVLEEYYPGVPEDNDNSGS